MQAFLCGALHVSNNTRKNTESLRWLLAHRAFTRRSKEGGGWGPGGWRETPLATCSEEKKYLKILRWQVTWLPRFHYPSLPTQPLSPLILFIIKDVIAARCDQATVRNTRWTKRLARYDPSRRSLIDDHGNTTSDRWPQQSRFACDESDNQTDVTSLAQPQRVPRPLNPIRPWFKQRDQ